ncbi:MAG: CoB--CoM heterodisulfide reductase iron-sulfur subunit A family protein [Chloroflexota bacterium]
MRRIGVFVCHCGTNIAGAVDVERVAEEIRKYPEVVFATDYKYMCSDPGQNLIKESIAEHRLDGVVVSACSPAMHEVTFRKTTESAGVNPYQCEIANIREQISWVHQKDQQAATQKAIETIRTLVEKVRYNESLVPFYLPLVKRALIIGGGIAGMTAALDIADAGYPVVLVERSDRLGGNMARLSRAYVNFDDANDLLSDTIERVSHHPNIQLLTNAEVSEVGGYVGNFIVDVNARANGAKEPFTFDIGAIVVATGYELYDRRNFGEYGGGRYPDVIDGLQFEGMLASKDGLRRPSDGREPKEVVWVQCAGSRDPELHKSYCSKICCMYVAKQTIAYKQRVPDGQAYVMYIDIRSQGRGYEEFVQTAMKEHDVLYLRGKASKIFQNGSGPVTVWSVDTLSGQNVEVQADLVVLASAVVPAGGSVELGQTIRSAVDEHGFFNEAHPKLRPVESITAGIFLAGAAQFAKDIPETVAQASGAASKVLGLFAQREMVQEPTVAYVDPELCSACGLCVPACPYSAREMHAWKPLATVNAALCQGCGACAMVCPNKASKVRNFTPHQILTMMDAYL